MANEKSEIRQELQERMSGTRSYGGDDRLDDMGKPDGPGFFRKDIFERIGLRDIAVFARQLALMQDVGISLMRALKISGKRSQNSKMRAIITDLTAHVEQGNTFSSGLEKYRKVFSEYFVVAVKSGEESGELSATLKQLADFMEKEELLRTKFRQSLSLPFITMLIAAVVVVYLLATVIPTFTDVYKDAGVELPGITLAVIAVSGFVKTAWWFIVALGIGVWLFLRYSSRVAGIKSMIDHVKLRLPYFSTITQKISVYRFARISSTMLKSGVSIFNTLQLAAGAAGNAVMARSIRNAWSKISEGKTLEQALAESKTLPPFVLDMIAVGEEVGAVPDVLTKVADYYERDVDNTFTNLVIIIEPALTLLMGLVVLVIALAILLPYFNISQVILP